MDDTVLCVSLLVFVTLCNGSAHLHQLSSSPVPLSAVLPALSLVKSLEPAAAVAMGAPSAAAAAAEPTSPPPSSTATDTPTATLSTTTAAAATATTASTDDGATSLSPLLPSEGAADTAAAASRPTLRSAIASGRAGVEAASAFVAAHASMPVAALARVDARVDTALASFTRALRRTRDGTTSGMVAVGGVLGGGALVAAPLAYGMCLLAAKGGCGLGGDAAGGTRLGEGARGGLGSRSADSYVFFFRPVRCLGVCAFVCLVILGAGPDVFLFPRWFLGAVPFFCWPCDAPPP